MGKNTRKPAVTRKQKPCLLKLALGDLKDKTKTKLIRKCQTPAFGERQTCQIVSLVNEDVLTCSICLQILLAPVQSPCGHTFCLCCSEDLAIHGFACGICHSHLPSYDLQNSNIIQKLLDDYLERRDLEERENYQKRKQELKRKQCNRRIKQVQEGNFLDFWCEEDLCWKSGTVIQKMKSGILTISAKKGLNEVEIHCDSRRLAPYKYFSKEEILPQAPPIQIRPMQLMPSASFQPMRMRMEDRPSIFGMPLFLGYYWRGEDFLNQGTIFDNQDPFNF